jgi:thiol-disulfide isomerase/thioredoxin
LLGQQVVDRYAGRVKFVSENFGASPLAARFGVDRYPAVFVDDILIARPRDFGFFGEGESAGRYAPWGRPENQARFQADLAHMIDLVLAGRKDQARRERPAAASNRETLDRLPPFALQDLAGRPLRRDQLAGRPVVVEIWASWCPPCLATLDWLGQLRRRYGDRLAVLALAVESPEARVRAATARLDPGLRTAITDAATARAFGDVVAVPTLFVFDRAGNTVRVFYGAPPDLHASVEKALAPLLAATR